MEVGCRRDGASNCAVYVMWHDSWVLHEIVGLPRMRGERMRDEGTALSARACEW